MEAAAEALPFEAANTQQSMAASPLQRVEPVTKGSRCGQSGGYE